MTDVKFVQEKILQVFLEFEKFCDEKGLEYGLCGGSLLGAVRHEGFIPWDDDLDVYMSRHDANILISEWRSDLYDIISFKDPLFYKPQTPIKIHDNNFRLKELNDDLYDYPELTNYGIFIDIFIYDYYYDNFIERLIQRYFGGILFAKRLSREGRAVKKNQRKVFIASFIPNVVLSTLEKLIGRVYGRRTNGTHVGFGFDNPSCNFFIEKERFIPFSRYRFCGLDLKGPSDSNEYLRQRFGNYMQLPDQNDRRNHILEIYEKRL